MADVMGFEDEVNCSAEMFYGFWKNKITQLPNLFPETFRSIQLIKGDGPTSVGSACLWKMELDGRFMTQKSEVTYVNNESKSMTWNFLEGDVMSLYRSFQIKLVSVTPTGERSCLVEWSVNFKKARSDYLVIPTGFINMLRKVTVKLASQLGKQG